MNQIICATMWWAKQSLGMERQSYALMGSVDALSGRKFIQRCCLLVESEMCVYQCDQCDEQSKRINREWRDKVALWGDYLCDQCDQQSKAKQSLRVDSTDKVALWWDRSTHFLDSGHGPGIRRAKGNQILVNLDWRMLMDKRQENRRENERNWK